MGLSIQQAKENGISNVNISKHLIVGATLTVALIAFEIFNFDTTRFALSNLLGDKAFATFTWAGILALAFCAIDFAGLAKIFTPEKGGDEPIYVWYLMGAWLIGATMNAMMTWWAVSITLLETPIGNEVLSREQILNYVPIFVAVLVWLTRILFIGALSIAGDQLLDFAIPERALIAQSKKQRTSVSSQELIQRSRRAPIRHQPRVRPDNTPLRHIAPRPVARVDDDDSGEEELVYEDPPTLLVEPPQPKRAAPVKPPKRSPQRSSQPRPMYRRKPIHRPNSHPQPMTTQGSDYSN